MLNIKPKRQTLKFFSKTGMYIMLIVISIIMLYPYLWSISASFKEDTQLYNGNPLDLIPSPFTMENYERALTVLPFGRFLLNSLITSTVVPFFMICISTLAAYAFARMNFAGKNFIFLLLLGVMMMPGHITLIPKYSLMRMLGWIDTYQALIIPQIFSANIVFNLFFMRQFYLSFPKELEEAAIIDGCSRFKIFTKIILPNSKPALATIAIISFKNQWNSLLWPLVVINDYKKMPIQVGLTYLQTNVDASWGALIAGATLSIVPVILIFIIFQRYFVNGMLSSGLTGR
ncbi:MAG: carbohydrate ABC transporter permease [Chloroflexi bacterium]|nr:carbohydrate ABC transporter permease [Chloroflexota bacterium]